MAVETETDPTIETERALLTTEQRRFLALHARRLVVNWRWLFNGGTLRAECSRGDVAAITCDGLELLFERGLMERLGYGAKLTPLGEQVAL